MTDLYLVVSIGNSDDKLKQSEWSDFCREMDNLMGRCGKIHFMSGSPNWFPWQNVAWIVKLLSPATMATASNDIAKIREKYKQESAFVMYGTGNFL